MPEEQSPPDLEIRVPPSPTAPWEARHALDALAPAMGPEALDTVRLLASELVSNSLKHAPLQPGDKIQIKAEATDTGVRVEVSDPGPGFHSPPRPSLTDANLGLYFVDKLADRWGVSTEGPAYVWFEVDRATR